MRLEDLFVDIRPKLCKTCQASVDCKLVGICCRKLPEKEFCVANLQLVLLMELLDELGQEKGVEVFKKGD